MPRIVVRDLELYYEMHPESVPAREGSARPRLLFIGGSGGDLRQKPSVFDGPLAASFQLLAYDQRGLGRTAIPEGPYTMADYGDDAAALLDALGWERCGVLGVSFGGMVAQELAVRHPERIERLVLACTSSGGAGGASYPLHTLEELPASEREQRALELSDRRLDAAWRAAQPEALDRILVQLRGRQAVGADEAGRARGQRLQLEARKGHDTFDRLAALDLPCLVCGGRYDGIAPPVNQEALRRQIPGARLELFEGGHLFLLQDPRALLRIESFLKGEPA